MVHGLEFTLSISTLVPALPFYSLGFLQHKTYKIRPRLVTTDDGNITHLESSKKWEQRASLHSSQLSLCQLNVWEANAASDSILFLIRL